MNIAIFASGSGSNAENIINHFANSENVNVSLVVTNKPDAYVLERAKKLNVESVVFKKAEFTTKVPQFLAAKNIDFIVLAGFLLLIPAELIKQFPQKIINIHPALLPKYGGKGMYGMNVHHAVKAANEKETGITIHLVNEFFDEGKIIAQHRCALNENDSADDIAEKIHKLEQSFFPKEIEKVLV